MSFAPSAAQNMLNTVGVAFSFCAAAIAFVVFAMLWPLKTKRRTVVLWMVAWAAYAILNIDSLRETVASALHPGIIARFPDSFAPINTLAFFVGPVAIVLASVRAARWSIGNRREVLVLLIAALVAVASYIADLDDKLMSYWDIAAPIAFFCAAQAIFWRAEGVGRRGLLFLGIALTGLVAVDELDRYAFALVTSPTTPANNLLGHVLFSWEPLLGGLSLAFLAASAAVVIVREVFQESEDAQAARIAAVESSELRLDSIIQAAQEAIITVGFDGAIELINDAVERMFAVSRNDVLGRPITQIVTATGVPFRDLFIVGPGGESHNRAATTRSGTGRRSDGSTFSVEFTVGALRGDGKSGAVVVLHDMTERIAQAAERVAFEHRLAESEKMMAIGRVVSGVAHELNNPLAVVLGQSEQMVGEANTPELRQALTLIYEQAYRARHIVKDLLAFVRHRDEVREPLMLPALIERTVASQTDAAAARGVALSAALPANLPAVFADRVGIEQVLVNLIDNALDAAGRGGTVRVSAMRRGPGVEVTVDDSGNGVVTENAERVFEPFFTTKGLGLGTGLGLSVSRAIVQQHGGTLVVEPTASPLGGARFVFSLPISSVVATPGVVSALPAFPRPPARGGGSTEVMLVDDEASVRSTLARMFRRHGWQVREAADGVEALAWLDNVPDGEAPLVILCDLKMPNLDGRGMFEQLKERRPLLAERVIFVTGDVVESVSSGFIASAGRAVVEKPFTIDEIARAVEVQLRDSE